MIHLHQPVKIYPTKQGHAACTGRVTAISEDGRYVTASRDGQPGRFVDVPVDKVEPMIKSTWPKCRKDF